MQRAISLAILVVLVVLLAILFYQVMIGFLLPLFVATLLAILFQPLHTRMVHWFRGHDRLAAGVTTAIILLIVLAPLAFTIFRAATEASAILSREHGGPQLNQEALEKIVGEVKQRFSLDLDAKKFAKELTETASTRAKDWFGPVAAKTPGFLGGLLINCLVIVLGLYYFLADGKQMTASAMRMLPLDQRYQQQLVGKFVEMSRAVTSASLVAAVTQGLLLGIAYYFSGLGGVFLLAILTMLASFVPLIGSAAVWISCSVWLYFADRPAAGILLLIWSAAVVVTTDNILKPMVLHGQAKLHPLLALLSVLGGVQLLGPLGIFFGPMAVAFLQAGLMMLNTELHSLQPGDDESAAEEPVGYDAKTGRGKHRKAKS
jgi:predicted PurR-regulated permease PerM